jgi:hypothetical protein
VALFFFLLLFLVSPDLFDFSIFSRTKKKMEKLRGAKDKLKAKKDKLKGQVGNRVNTFKVWKMKDEDLDRHFEKKYLEDIESHFQTGDIILSRGTEAFSLLIRKGTMSTWSHAAMIVVDPSPEVREVYKIDQYHEEDLKERVFIFESDTETQDKRAGGGTQLFPFRRWLQCCVKEYTDNYLVVWRSLRRPEHHHGKKDHEVFVDWDKFLISMAKRSYESSRCQLVFSALHSNKAEDLSTVFCSELVAASLKHMGLLAPDTNSNNFVPRDFTSDQRIDGRDITLLNGFTFTKEIRIRFKPKDPENKEIQEMVMSISPPSSS